MKKANSIGFALVCACLIGSCKVDNSVQVQMLINQQVKKRLHEYIEAEKKRCRVKILEEASTLADSILRANPVFIALDSLQRPPVPIRPPRPEFERKTDSIKIEPIIPVRREEENR
ncbi:MAG: hypothetical protein IPL46_07385 [Saprospiraceae bacterium]|nr:hypothetical protein [Saprospiraceae bacterium]